MAVSVTEELHCRSEKPIFISSSEHSPVATKATELNVADDGKDSNECKHFTIRGYVSEVRKRDANISWPFQHHNCSPHECAKMLPPLHVAQFRWWDCQNCVHEITGNAAEMATERALCLEAIRNDKKRSLQESISEASRLVTKKVLSKLPQISEGNHQESLLMDDCPAKNSMDGKTESEYVLRDLMHKGSQISKGDQDKTDEKQIPSGEANYVPVIFEAPKLRENGKLENSSNRKRLGFAHSKHSSNAILSRNNETRLHQMRHSSMLDGHTTSLRTNIAVYSTEDVEVLHKMKTNSNEVKKQLTKNVHVDLVVEKDDVLDANLGHTLRHDAYCKDERSYEALGDNANNMVWTDENTEIVSPVVERLNDKKVRKVRLLEDIIRCEEQNLPRNCCILDKNSKTINGDGTRRRDILKKKVLLLNHKSNGDKNPKTINGDVTRRRDILKKKVLLLNHKSDGDTLNNRLKSVQTYKSQRSMDDNEDEEEGTPNFLRGHLAQRDFINPFERGNRAEVIPDEGEGPSLMHWLKANACKERSNAYSINCPISISDIYADMSDGKNRDDNVKDSGKRMYEQKTPVYLKQTSITKDGQVASSIRIPKSIRSKNTRIVGKTQHCSLETKDNTGRKVFLPKMRNKRPIIGSGKPSQTKDASAAQQQAASEGQEEVTKAQRNVATAKEALDDIPMDIVELLARNQHERHHLIAETDSGSNHKMSEMNGSTKINNGLDAIQTNGNIVSDAEQRNLSHQKFQVSDKGFGVKTIFSRDVDINLGLKIHNFPINGKKILHIDLNRHYDPVIDKAMSCDLNSNEDCNELNFSCCEANVKASQQWLMDPKTACQHFCRNSNDGERLHINNNSFGVKTRVYKKPNPSILDSNMELFAHLDDCQNPRNLIGRDQQFFSKNETSSASTSTELANRHQFKVGPVNVYSNENISALNLLRLMDWAAWSREPQHCLEGYTRFTKESGIYANDRCNEPLGSECGGRRKEPCICPLDMINMHTSPQPRNSCLPYRPLPRIGVLGPALQKEIWNSSSLSGIPFRNSAALFIQTGEKEKTETSQLRQSETSLARCKCSAKVGPNGGLGTFLNSNTVASSACDDIAQNEVRQRVDTVLPRLGFCKVEICVVNRNPADFTMLEENNQYMIEMKDIKHKSLPRSGGYRGSVHVQKKQRVMKLADLKGFAVG